MNNYGFKPTIKDLSGQKFGLWTVVKLAGRNGKREAQWLCRCQCGTERVISSYDLKHGRTHGCIKCAHKEGRAGHRFNAKGSLDRAIAAVQNLVNNGYPLDDMLIRLNEERNKL
jgi:hypothetical protein